jgi:hypothetical protein
MGFRPWDPKTLYVSPPKKSKHPGEGKVKK